MKVGSELQFEVPDDCPENCCGKDESRYRYQGDICCRCPITNCKTIIIPEEDRHFAGDTLRLMNPKDYSDDLAEAYVEMFEDLKKSTINYKGISLGLTQKEIDTLCNLVIKRKIELKEIHKKLKKKTEITI